jgi:chromosome segregation ATPase
MKLTTLLLVLVAGLAVGVGVLYLKLQDQATTYARLERDHAQLLKTHSELEAAKIAQGEAETEEVLRLRKENEELLRLRNEVQQLRAEKKTLNQQVQTVQQQAQAVQQQAQNAAQALQTQTQGVKTNLSAAEVEMFRKRYGINPPTTPATPEQQQQMACINNLRQIDGAMQQWALENKRAQGSPVGSTDLLPYLRGNALPACPGGGAYTIVSVGVPPICNIAGHKIGN